MFECADVRETPKALDGRLLGYLTPQTQALSSPKFRKFTGLATSFSSSSSVPNVIRSTVLDLAALGRNSRLREAIDIMRTPLRDRTLVLSFPRDYYYPRSPLGTPAFSDWTMPFHAVRPLRRWELGTCPFCFQPRRVDRCFHQAP